MTIRVTKRQFNSPQTNGLLTVHLRTKILTLVAVACLLATTSTESSASLMIIRNFSGGGSAPGSAVGGGTLESVFNAAADMWEDAYPDPNGDGSNFTLTIDFGWDGLGGSTLGVHNLLSQGGTPNRETSARIRFDNDGTSNWFIDATPTDNSEYTTFIESSLDLGGGLINTERRYTGATGFALTNHDLLTVALHEIGHALGLSSANNSFISEAGMDRDVDVEFGQPWSGGYGGSVIPISASSAHININSSLMFPSLGASQRRLIGDVDILANAQISNFHNPVFSNQDPVPEPGSILIWSAVGVGLIGGAARQRRKKRNAKAQKAIER